MDELQQLSDAVRQYEEGDLLAVAEIRENAEALYSSVSDDQVKQVLDNIVKTAEEIVLQGPSKENSQRLQELGEALVAKPEDTSTQSKKPAKKKGQKQSSKKSEKKAAPDIKEIPIEDAEILSSFLVEAHDHLDDIEERILDLEKNYDEQTVHDIFRSMHTIKGVSSFIGLSKIKGFTHRLETVLNAMRTGELEIEDELVDILLNGGDVLQQMVSDIEAQAEGLDTSSGEAVIYEGRVDTSEIDTRLEPYLQKIESGAAEEKTAGVVEESGKQTATAAAGTQDKPEKTFTE